MPHVDLTKVAEYVAEAAKAYSQTSAPCRPELAETSSKAVWPCSCERLQIKEQRSGGRRARCVRPPRGAVVMLTGDGRDADRTTRMVSPSSPTVR